MAKTPKLGERLCPQCKEIIQADALICKHCGTKFTDEEVAAAKSKAAKGKRNLGFGCLGLVLALGFCTYVVGGDDPAKQSASKTVAGADPQIAEVRAYDITKHGEIKVNFDQMWSAKDIPMKAAMVVEAVGKSIKAGATDMPKSTETLTFWFTAPSVDAYGRDGRSKAIQFDMKADDLRKVEYGKIATTGLLEFATGVEVRPMARSGVAEYCAENLRDNPRFCAEAD